MNTSAPDLGPSKQKDSCPEDWYWSVTRISSRGVASGVGGLHSSGEAGTSLISCQEHTYTIEKAMPKKHSRCLSGCCLNVFFIKGGNYDAVPRKYCQET